MNIDMVELNAVNVCRDLVAWWEKGESVLPDTAVSVVPAFVNRAREVVATYDTEIQRYREPCKPGDFSPNAEAARRHQA